jgi:hypothetical protein
MAGRRLRWRDQEKCDLHVLIRLSYHREAVRANLISNGITGDDAYVVIAGPANSYAHYVTTIEEYGMQRYEGASTIFGPCEFSWPTS